MSFLQPALLAALPLIALPIIIHLINQRRYQTVRWGAMMFLLAANRMSRGYARIRQWLIMAARMAAIGGLLFAASRPLAGGWLGFAAGGRADTTVIVLDRSPSTEQGGGGGAGSKRETGVAQLARALGTLGSSRWVLIDGPGSPPRELAEIDQLLTTPAVGPSSASADLPAMLQTARDYVRDNKPGRTEVWICSDLRANDWDAEGGRWQALRDAFLEFPQGVRFHLLAYPQPATDNLAVRVTDVRRRGTGDAAELLVSLRLTREGGGDGRRTVPVQLEIEGARSEVAVEMDGPKYDLKDYRIPLEKGRERGWGRVTIPADGNPSDNDFYFAFEPPAPRRALIVADDPQAARPLQLAASIAPDPSVKCSAEVIEPGQVASTDWDDVALLLWQAPLPEGDAAKAVQAYVGRGGTAVFLAPRTPGPAKLFGAQWGAWSGGTNDVAVENWRGDEDLLANTQSGSALPVGTLKVRRWCGLTGEMTPLATLRGGAALLARATTDRGAAYFCATTPAGSDSSLAVDGIVLYVLTQRAMALGAANLGNTRNLVAGAATGEDSTGWQRLAGGAEGVSTDFTRHAGVYRSGERLLAVNRAAAEDAAPVLADARVAGLFKGLDFSRVDDRAGSAGSLIQEVWRMFLFAMLAALVAEAALCLPKPAPARPAAVAVGGVTA